MLAAEVRNLTKTYPAFRLENVSFGVEAGRITGFVGRNGAGKTTTIKSLLHLVQPDSGEIFFFARPFGEQEEALKLRIGYSTGTVNWYPHRKLRDIVSVVKDFYDTWDEAAYQKYLRLFALDENKTPAELSEGMKVKYNLLLALSHRAELLILDEPTSGLDPFSREELLSVFTQLKAEGVAVFFSTHIISDVEKCADDLVYLSRGKVAAAMPKAAFLAQYARAGETLEATLLRLEGEAQHE